jgi:hypothetical protein
VGVVGVGSSVVVVVVVVGLVVMDGLGEGAAVVDVGDVEVVGDWVGDGEEAAVVMMVGVLAAGVVAVDVVPVAVVAGVEADAASESVVVVPAGGGSVPFFMFSNTAPDDRTKMISAAALYEVIQLRDGTRPAWPSCLTSYNHWWRVNSRVRRAAGLRGWSIGCRTGFGRGEEGDVREAI